MCSFVCNCNSLRKTIAVHPPPGHEFADDDPAGTIQRMASLMGVSLTEAQAQRVQYLSSFEHLKSIDHTFYPGEVSPFARPGGSMIRSGKKGNSDELLTPAQQAHIDAWCKAGLARLGSDFPYERYFG